MERFRPPWSYCEHCPLAGSGLGCVGHVLGNAAVCGRMKEGHPHRETTALRLRRLARRFGWADGTEGPPTAAEREHEPGGTNDLPPGSPPGLAATYRRLALIRRFAADCPYGSPPSGSCGCLRKCHADRGGGADRSLASMDDCGRCLDEAIPSVAIPTP